MRISVVIPSFNHARFIGEAIASVASQAFPDLELVVVDDGSTDGTREAARRAIESAGRALRGAALHEQENAGAHAAIGRGIAASTGDWVAILNSDDAWRPGRLLAIADRIAGRERFIAFTGVDLVDAGSAPLAPGSAHGKWYARARAEAAEVPTVGFGLLRNNFAVTTSNLVFSRALYDAVGPFAPLRLCHDWDFLMRATREVEPDFLEDAPPVAYRVHDANASHALRDIQESEGREALGRFLRACVAGAPPRNERAPCPRCWTHYFPVFARKYAFHFGARPVADYMDGAGA